MRRSSSASSCGEWAASKMPPQVHRPFVEILVPPDQILERNRHCYLLPTTISADAVSATATYATASPMIE